MGKLTDLLGRSSASDTPGRGSSGSHLHAPSSEQGSESSTGKEHLLKEDAFDGGKVESGDEYDEVAHLNTADEPQSLAGPTGVFPAYCAQGGAVSIQIKADSAMSAKNWTIKDTGTGDVVFSVKGKDMSVKVEKVFTDAKGQDVLKLRRHNAWMYGNYYVEDMDNQEVMTFERHGKVVTATFVDHITQQRRELRVDAKWSKSRGWVFLDGMYLGVIAKAADSSRSGMCPTYQIRVPEGMDVSLMAALGVVFARLVTEWNEGLMSVTAGVGRVVVT